MKNNYFFYNLKGIARSLIPSAFLPRNRERILRDLDKREDLDYIKWRVEYYCRLSEAFSLDSNAWRLSDLRWTRKKTVYFFDSYEYAMYFPQDFRANFEFGDVNYVCGKPSITKSRPIDKGNSSLTQSLRELEKASIDRRQALSHSAFSSQPTNLTQDTRIANADYATNIATKSDKNSTSTTASRRLDERSEVPNTRIFKESMGDSAKDSSDSAESNAESLESSLRGQRPKQSILQNQKSGDFADSGDKGDSPQPPFANSTLLNLEKIRHFTFINDPYNFDDKIPKLFYRGGIYQSHRVKFFEKYFNHPLCDLGHTGSKSVHKEWQKPKISIAEHLPYKFLLSLEGNDVASNLKWAMSSNSLVFSPKPKFETWFMEGTLIGGVHFVEIKPDYSDLEEKLRYFIANPKKAKEIIHNAHIYCQQFFDKRREDIISLLVLEKYFFYAGQIDKMRL